MNLSDIFGRTIECECGKTHTIEPREVLYQPHAINALPAVCARVVDTRSVAVIMDARTREVAGLSICKALIVADWQVRALLVPDPAKGKSPVCDDITKNTLADTIGDAGLLISVGGGVMTDLARWIAMDKRLPFISFATAASMNGYTSGNIAASVGGVKVIVDGKPPLVVASDPAIIRRAPWELTASGLGDILAKSVSSADWLLNHLLFGDYYCARSVNLIAEIEPLYLMRPANLKARSARAIEALYQGLLLTGAAMTMAGTSAPASGGEHLISHTLDMMSSLDGHEHDLHGRQVGIGTLLAAELYRRVLAIKSPQFVRHGPSVDRAFWGKLADGVQEQQDAKQERLQVAVEKLSQKDQWDKLRQSLAPLARRPRIIRNCLTKADAAYRAEHIKCTKERLLAAFLHAHEMRSRFTILDMARLTGVMPRSANEIIETCA
jgi:glycerol-1-phosphate dehydrogenase [NAD(P)+]